MIFIRIVKFNMANNNLATKIKDYLKIQGLDLTFETIHEKAFILETIKHNGEFTPSDKIPETLKFFNKNKKTIQFPEILDKNTDYLLILKKISALFEITLAETPNIQNAVVFFPISINPTEKIIIPLCQSGKTAKQLNLNSKNLNQHLTVRVFLSRWLTIVDNPKQWMADNELIDNHHLAIKFAFACPVINEEDQVLAVIHAESENAAYDQNVLEWWVALAIVVEELIISLYSLIQPEYSPY